MSRLFRDAVGPCLQPRGSVVCIGAFDGVHRGHCAVLQRVRENAGRAGLASVAVSFAPIPRVYFARSAAVPQLTSTREKIAALLAVGMDMVLLMRFNAALAAMSAQDFVKRVLVDRLAAREVWVGEEFRFGHARQGDLNLLRELGSRHGFTADAVAHVEVDGERISSSAIRVALVNGEFDHAARLLGRRFTMGGHVVRGLQLGRKLGYPTANLHLYGRTAPIGGVFAVWVHGVRGEPMPGVASLGVRPTVDGTEPLLEAHLFDFDGDLYGRRINIEFVRKLRDEEKFDGLEAMVSQIDRDAAQARTILETPVLEQGSGGRT